MKKNDEILQGNLYFGIAGCALPLCLCNAFQVLFNILNIAIVGKFAGSNALGSVGSCTMLTSLFSNLLLGFGSAISVIVARYRGSGNVEKMRRSIFTSFVISCINGLIFLVVGVGLAKTLLIAINTKEDLLPGAVTYLRIYFAAIPGCTLYNYGAAIYMSVGETKKPMFVLLGSGLLNLALNYLFVVYGGMNTSGVALASCISQYASALMVLAMLMFTKNDYRLCLDRNLYDKNLVGQILRLAIPSGASNAVFYVGNLFIQKAVNYFPTTVVNGDSASANADSLIYAVMAAFYSVGASYISQNYGAGNKKRILKSYLISTGYAFAIGAAMGLCVYGMGESFLGLFTNEQTVISAGMERLKVMAFSYGFSAFMDGTIVACRGLGKSSVPTILVILGSCIFRIAWVYTVFEHYHTITSLYLLYICSWMLTAAMELAYFISVYRSKIKEISPTNH